MHRRHSSPTIWLRCVAPLLAGFLLLNGALLADSPQIAAAQKRTLELNQYQRYKEALPFNKRLLKLIRRDFGEGSIQEGRALFLLGKIRRHLGHHEKADVAHRQALSILDRSMSADDPSAINDLMSLAWIHADLGNSDESEEIFERAVALLEQKKGEEHPRVATMITELASLYARQFDLTRAEPLYKTALASLEKTQGPTTPIVAKTLNSLATLYFEHGRYRDAEVLLKRCLSIREKRLGLDHVLVADNLNDIARLYMEQGRLNDIENLYRRAIAIRETSMGTEHLGLIPVLQNLAHFYNDSSRSEEAEILLQRADSIIEKKLGREHHSVATNLALIAATLAQSQRHDDASNAFIKATAIYEKSLGLNHPQVAQMLLDRGFLSIKRNNPEDAEPLFHNALSIVKAVYSSDHPAIADGYHALGLVKTSLQQYREALSWTRHGNEALRRRFTTAKTSQGDQLRNEQRKNSDRFIAHVTLALHPQQAGHRSGLESEAFEVLQLARASRTGNAIGQMAARFASGDNEIATLVRVQQDAQAHYANLDADLNKALGKPTDQQDAHRLGIIRRDISATKERLKELQVTIEKAFPQYASLVSREPLTMADTQTLLKKNEALITFVGSSKGDQTHVFVVRKDRASAYTVDLGAETLEAQVKTLRKGVDSSNIQSLADVPAFDVAEAHTLYQTLLGPSEALLSGVEHLFVVPSGALESLPLGVLVTEKPRIPEELADYRHIPWLYKQYAITTLPSVASLKSLRVFAKEGKAQAPFIGFGDPILGGEKGTSRGLNIATFFRGNIADVEKVRNLANLPNTNKELRRLAKHLGASNDDLYLREAATETKVKAVTLNNSQVVAFATHGLISGDIKGLAEPALVMTPPNTGTRHDDGLLTASEVAKLKLNAEWVLLSACNTAAADNPGAEGLSGLAKAFFYAGTRALLVSHWPVESTSATLLTTGLFETLEKNPNLGKAEALRQSMLTLMHHNSQPFYAHPLFWAPFVVVGEGG